MADKTTIQVSDATWRYLKRECDRGETYDDVLRRELLVEEEAQ